MIDPKKIAETEQAVAAISESIPPLLWGLYQGLVGHGFTEAQPLFLTAEYLKAFAKP